ncbi:MAG TPA: hypothetical protein VLE99_00385 [Candidatus Saccharimonadales bacterium]|nr:hypothetical protein [Candidatus Saccharimonadales bacterium]
MFRYLGLALVLLSWAAGGYLLSRWHNKDLPTLSKHGASSTQAYALFAGSLAVLGTLFYWWLVAWFAPHLHLGTLFVATTTLAMSCQVITGLVPDTTGWLRRVHRTTAYTMAVSYLPMAILIISAPASAAVRILCTLLACYMAITFTAVVLFGRSRQRFLQFQIAYIGAFQVVILLAAYA